MTSDVAWGSSRVDFLELARAMGREAFARNKLAAMQMWAELLAQYPHQWVAVANGRVFGPAGDWERVRAELRDVGIKPGDAYFAYLDPAAATERPATGEQSAPVAPHTRAA